MAGVQGIPWGTLSGKTQRITSHTTVHNREAPSAVFNPQHPYPSVNLNFTAYGTQLDERLPVPVPPPRNLCNVPQPLRSQHGIAYKEACNIYLHELAPTPYRPLCVPIGPKQRRGQGATAQTAVPWTDGDYAHQQTTDTSLRHFRTTDITRRNGAVNKPVLHITTNGVKDATAITLQQYTGQGPCLTQNECSTPLPGQGNPMTCSTDASLLRHRKALAPPRLSAVYSTPRHVVQ